jgi:hypothetical protein
MLPQSRNIGITDGDLVEKLGTFTGMAPEKRRLELIRGTLFQIKLWLEHAFGLVQGQGRKP